MAREFSEISNEYSEKKVAFQDIKTHLDEIMNLRETIENYEQQINSLQAKKANLSIFNAFFMEEDISSKQADIDTQINQIKDEINALKNNSLYRTKEQIEEASSSLDSYLEDLNTNNEFKKVVREHLIADAEKTLPTLQEDKNKPALTLNILNKIEESAKDDISLKGLLTIDKDKAKVALLEELLAETNNIKPGSKGSKADEAKAERDIALQVYQKQINNMKRKIESKGNILKTYITNNKEKLGIPDDLDINFDDKNSPLYYIGQYANSDSSISFDDIKKKANDSLKFYDKKIAICQNMIRYAKKDVEELKSQKAFSGKGLKSFEDFGLVSKVKRFFVGIGKGISNWINDKPHPFKNVFNRVETPVIDSQTKIVDTDNNFKDFIHTEIGQDAYQRVFNEYNRKIKSQTSRAQDDREDR
ncbi:MAG: hypothetical protein ACLU8Y_06685 [Clostridia bacterium]|jgi:hypothetical protein